MKSFLREYELKPEMTLYNLNNYIMNDLDFSPDQMVLFCGLDDSGNSVSRYGLFDLGFGSLDHVTIGDVISKGELDLQYFYDLRNEKYLLLSVVDEYEELPRVSYPRTVVEKGRNPNQFAAKYEDWDTMEDFSIEEENIADYSEDLGDE